MSDLSSMTETSSRPNQKKRQSPAVDAASRLARLTSPESLAAATPVMAQYLDVKAAHPDDLVFFQMGDFYELFFHDAVKAAQELDITLSKRGQHMGEDVPMSGVPVQTVDDYLRTLIDRGHSVAICDQTEDPAAARKRGSKAVIQRQVTRLVTRGTVTEDKLLTPSRSNYLMALAQVRGDTGNHRKSPGGLALAWVDISTGTFCLAETDAGRLVADVMRLDPQELIVADSVFHDETLRPGFDHLGAIVRPQPTVLFDSGSAEGRLARFFGVTTLDGFGTFSRAELAAAAAVVAYVDKTQLAGRPLLSRPERESGGSTLFIDAATRTNLELMKTLSGDRDGGLLKTIDRTVTGGGARLLAERLTSPLTDPDGINHRLDAVSWFLADTALADATRKVLRGSADMPRALSRLALGRGGPRDLGIIHQGFEAAGMLANLLVGKDAPAEIAGAVTNLRALPEPVGLLLEEKLAEDLPLVRRDGGFVRSGHHEELDAMRTLRDESRKVIAGLQQHYADETGIKSLKIRHNNVLGYFIEVTANRAATLTGSDEARARFIHRQTTASLMRFTTTELADLESRIANAADRALTIELGIFDTLAQTVIEAADPIRRAARAIALIDVSAALARLADQQAYCRPVVDRSTRFRIVGGRHPVVELALRNQAESPFVANDCDLSPSEGAKEGAIWLLTGPNMGGKSTFLRQNALIAILAQTGSFVPAGSAEIGVVDRLFSRVGASDDLARGRSTFMVEMVETAAILNQASERSLVILDEIGRGTATFDGLSIAWAAVEHLHEVNRCRGLFATHFHELTVLSEKLPRLANATMRVKEWEGDVIFLHEVGPGAADRSYGIQVARLAGLPASVVARARAVLDQLEESERQSPGRQLIDGLPLFSAEVERKSVSRSGPSEIEAELAALDPDDMTAREALETLYALRAKLLHMQERNSDRKQGGAQHNM